MLGNIALAGFSENMSVYFLWLASLGIKCSLGKKRLVHHSPAGDNQDQEAAEVSSQERGEKIQQMQLEQWIQTEGVN